ncbi:MAG: hypothetical protein OSB69_16675 [Alphaproteobacteria bacterium]|nr:hypothetical protein [Alphaproteobacteria bacterium]
MPGEPLHPAAAGRRQPNPEFWKAKAHMLGGDHRIRREHCFEATTNRDAIDLGDHRFRQIKEIGEAGEAFGRGILVTGLQNIFEVRAGAERAVACPGNHFEPGLRMRREGNEDSG